MTHNALFAPVFAQLFLTLLVVLWLGYLRVSVRIKGTSIRPAERHLKATFPPLAQQAADNLSNQFELPVLFYLTCVLAIMLGIESGVLQILAWVFVASRIGHAAIHLSVNRVTRRFTFWVIGLFAWAAMLLILVVYYLQQ